MHTNYLVVCTIFYQNSMQVFHTEETVAKEAANKVMKRFAERMNKAEAESKVMHSTMSRQWPCTCLAVF